MVKTNRLALAVLLGLGWMAIDRPVTAQDLKLIDHVLVDQHGNKQRFVSDVIGDKKVVIAGIYTGCSTICPITTLLFAELQDALDDHMETDVRLVSLSVDPVTDTPSVLAKAAAEVDARAGWTWLTGAPSSVSEVLLGLGSYSADITEHPPVFVVGDGVTGDFVQLYGFPAIEEILDALDLPTPAGS